MTDFNFTKLKKISKGHAKAMVDCVSVGNHSFSIAGNLFDADKVMVKLDIDTDNNAIRVRKGKEGGSRSYVASRNSAGSKAYSLNLPSEMRKLVDNGELRTGRYELVRGTDDIFVLA